VRTGTRGRKSLTLGDLRAVQQQIRLVFNISPNVDTGVQAIYGIQKLVIMLPGVRRLRSSLSVAAKQEPNADND
jgi:hypothetical protein